VTAYQEFKQAVRRAEERGAHVWFIQIDEVFLNKLKEEKVHLVPASEPNKYFLDNYLISVVENPNELPEVWKDGNSEAVRTPGTNRAVSAG
jgi:hypothetical protein